jgi:hypothetical protein
MLLLKRKKVKPKKKVSNMYFIYWHKKADDGIIFYVGLGKRKKREKSFANRNKFWHNTVNKHGFIPEIVAENLTEDKAKKN